MNPIVRGGGEGQKIEKHCMARLPEIKGLRQGNRVRLLNSYFITEGVGVTQITFIAQVCPPLTLSKLIPRRSLVFYSIKLAHTHTNTHALNQHTHTTNAQWHGRAHAHARTHTGKHRIQIHTHKNAHRRTYTNSRANNHTFTYMIAPHSMHTIICKPKIFTCT